MTPSDELFVALIGGFVVLVVAEVTFRAGRVDPRLRPFAVLLIAWLIAMVGVVATNLDLREGVVAAVFMGVMAMGMHDVLRAWLGEA